MGSFIKKYDNLKMDFKLYKKDMESKLKILEDIVNFTGYVNTIISKPNFLEEINNLLIAKDGVDYSTICLIENNKYKVKVSNVEIRRLILDNVDVSVYNNNEVKIMSVDEIYINCKGVVSKSIISIPLMISEKVKGYIFLESLKENYFNESHKQYLKIVSNHIAIAIENAELYRNLEIAAETDSLTGIYNRDAFFSKVENKIKNKNSYGIVMIDIDNFKLINDNYGHYAGDLVIKETAKIILECLEKNDIIGRYGGEELVIYIDKVDVEFDVYNRVEYIRRQVYNNTIFVDGNDIGVTISLGLGFRKECESLIDVIKRSDKLLYKAKRNGKNRVEY